MAIPRYAGNPFAARAVIAKLRTADVITDTMTDEQVQHTVAAYARLRDAGMSLGDALATMALPPVRGELPALEDAPELAY